MAKSTGKLVFLDTETTSLAKHRHIWEMAYAVDTGRVFAGLVPHSLIGSDPKALEIGNYWLRQGFNMSLWSEYIEEDLYNQLEGATIVASNPTFDAESLERRWGTFDLWHHRMIDLESYALGRLWNDDIMRGQYDIAVELRARGYNVPLPDHSAGADVACLQACYYTLKKNF